MPRIPLPQQTAVTAAPYQGSAPADKTAQYQGSAALAAGIGDVGGAMVQFAERSAAIRNEKALTNGKLVMDHTRADIQADLDANPNPEDWDKLAEKRLQDASGEIFVSKEGAELAPAVRRQLEQDYHVFAQQTSTTVRNQSLRKQNDEADALFTLEQNNFVKAGNLDGALATVEKRRRLGTISDVQATLTSAQVRYDVDKQAVATAILDDPQGAIDQIDDQTEGGKYRNFTNLSDSDRRIARRAAHEALSTRHAETAQAFAEEIYQADNQGTSIATLGIDKRIDAAVAKNQILPSQANNLKKLANGTMTPAEQSAIGVQLWNAAVNLDPASADAKQQEMEIRAEAHGLSPEVRDPILDTLNQRRTNTMPEVVRHAYSLLERDYQAATDRWTKTELDALKSVEKKALGSPKVGDFKDRENGPVASEKLFRYQIAMGKWIGANTKATSEQILAERSRLVATDDSVVDADLFIDAGTGAAP